MMDVEQQKAARILLSKTTLPLPSTVETAVSRIGGILKTTKASDLLEEFPQDNFVSDIENMSGKPVFDVRRFALRTLYESGNEDVVKEFNIRMAKSIADHYRTNANIDMGNMEAKRAVNMIENEIVMYYKFGTQKLLDRLRVDSALRASFLDAGEYKTIATFEEMKNAEQERLDEIKAKLEKERETMRVAKKVAREFVRSRPRRSGAVSYVESDEDADESSSPRRLARVDEDTEWTQVDEDDAEDSDDYDEYDELKNGAIATPSTPRRPSKPKPDSKPQRTVRSGSAVFKNLVMEETMSESTWDLTVDAKRRATMVRADPTLTAFHEDAVVSAVLSDGTTLTFARTWFQEDEDAYDAARPASDEGGDDLETMWEDVRDEFYEDSEDDTIDGGELFKQLRDGDDIDDEQMVSALVDDESFSQYDVPSPVREMMEASSRVDHDGSSSPVRYPLPPMAAVIELTQNRTDIEHLTLTSASRMHMSTPLELQTLPRIVALKRARNPALLQLSEHVEVTQSRPRKTRVPSEARIPRPPAGTKKEAVDVDEIFKELVDADLSKAADGGTSIRGTLLGMSTSDRNVVNSYRAQQFSHVEVHAHVTDLPAKKPKGKLPTKKSKEKAPSMGVCKIQASDIEALHPDFVASLTSHNFANFMADNACDSTRGGRPEHRSKVKTEAGYDNFTIGVYKEGDAAPYIRLAGREKDQSRTMVRHGSYSDPCTANIVCNWLNSQPYEVRMRTNAGRYFLDFLMPPAFVPSDAGDYVSMSEDSHDISQGPSDSMTSSRPVIWGKMTRPSTAEGVLSSEFYPSYGSAVTLTGKRGKKTAITIPFSPMAALTNHEFIESKIHAMLGVPDETEALMT